MSTGDFWFDDSRISMVSRLTIFGIPFVLTGVLAWQVVEWFEVIAVPLDDVQSRSMLENITLLPHWLDPVTLSFETLFGLRSSIFVAAIALWCLAPASIALVTGVYWWAVDYDTSGFLPPVRRLGWLLGFTVLLSLGAVVTGYYLSGIEPFSLLGEFYMLEYVGIGSGLIEWVGVLLFAFFVGRFYVAPVSIVVDGRGPIDALQWSFQVTGTLTRVYLTTVLVLALAWVRGWLPWLLDLLWPRSDQFAVTVVVGTVVLVSVQSLAMSVVHQSIAMERDAAET